MAIDLTKPLKFKPNIRWEAADATTGYIWGKPFAQSNILAGLPAELRESLDIPQDAIVAERWLCTDDRGISSEVIIEDGSAIPLADLLETDGEAILGPKHWAEYGPFLGSIMKLLDTHPDKNRGSLSVQLHPKPGHPTRPSKPEMWQGESSTISVLERGRPGVQGEGTVYLGWNQDMTPEKIQAAIEASQLENYMNVIELHPGRLVLVTGGLIHAIRFNSFLSEWSMAPGRDDIEKGNLKDATVAPYDRTDGKTPRPGKEDFDGSMEVMTDADTFGKTEEADLLTKPELLADADGNKHLALFRTPVVFVDQFRIETNTKLSVAERGKPLFVRSGSVSIEHNGQEVDLVTAGEERFIPHAMGEVMLKNTAPEASMVNVWYTPFAAEKTKL